MDSRVDLMDTELYALGLRIGELDTLNRILNCGTLSDEHYGAYNSFCQGGIELIELLDVLIFEKRRMIERGLRTEGDVMDIASYGIIKERVMKGVVHAAKTIGEYENLSLEQHF